MSDVDVKATVADVPVPVFENPAFHRPRPLSESRVAIVTTAALHVQGEPGWQSKDQSFRVIPATTEGLIIGHVSPNYDRSGFLIDPNVVYPVDRLKEMVAEGVIGSLAERHLTFLGAQDETMTTIRMDTGPAAAKILREQGVDVVLLTPVCPLCTRTAGTLAHVLEAEGFATVQLSLVRSQTERLKPPRALYCPFPLGRPLGKPNDAHFQRQVLDQAFALLERPSGPVLEDYPEAIDDVEDSVFECTIPVRMQSGLPAAVEEALALRPAYNRQLARTGRTVVGRAIGVERIAEAVGAFVSVSQGGALAELSSLGAPRFVAADIRAYYEEAAMELADHVPAAHAPEAWFYTKTAAGQCIRKVQPMLRDAGLPQPDWFFLVPRAYQQP